MNVNLDYSYQYHYCCQNSHCWIQVPLVLLVTQCTQYIHGLYFMCLVFFYLLFLCCLQFAKRNSGKQQNPWVIVIVPVGNIARADKKAKGTMPLLNA